MTQDRDTITIKGKRILHATARRDYVCGQCGYGLATRYLDGEWRTVCAGDAEHDADGFVHRRAVPYIIHRNMAEDIKAAEVLAHLPPELQKAIEANRERTEDKCPSKD